MTDVNQLAPLALAPLAPGRVRPRGWLAAQMRIQADGITGQLDEFWPDVAESGWIGGDAEGWERAPYWLDGLVPLAFALDDARLKAKAARWVDHILAHQHEDGWLGPVKSARGNYRAYDPWPVFVTLKALAQYADATGDARIEAAMARFFARLDTLLDEQPLFDWGRYRWGDLLLSIYWLHERRPDERLLALAAKVHDQGFDWRGHFERFELTVKTPRGEANLTSHVVNNAMGIKMPGIWWRQSGDHADRAAADTILDELDRHHGQATGVFSGDEHLAGLSPSQGTETCAVVEMMYSLEQLIALFGEVRHCDRLERIAFNALPGAFTPDMLAHQYDQQANQVNCVIGRHVWTTNGDDANTFGLAPNYGCCTANLHQGWPKLTTHLWLATPDGGLAATAFAPCAVSAELGGVAVRIEEETDYPRSGTIRFTVRCASGVRFPLRLRIPAWAEGAALTVGGEAVAARPGEWVQIERSWCDGDAVLLELPLGVRIEARPSAGVTLTRGPLLFSLKIGEAFHEVGRVGPVVDYEIRPTTPWNVALELDAATPERSVEVEMGEWSAQPFDPERPPVALWVRGRRVKTWGFDAGAHDAEPPPPGPVASHEPPAQVRLIPYGSAHLRITEFPVLGEPEQQTGALP